VGIVIARYAVATALILPALTAAPARSRGDAGDARTVSVFAAASLSGAFRAIAAAYEAQHPERKITLNFAGSPTLVRQIQDGAPADVFAAADEASMQRLVAAKGVAGEPHIFARNRLQIVVEKGNPERIAGLADLTRPGLVVVLCGETVPAGRYALEAFQKAGVPPPAGSRELDVKAVVSKVQLGEADAGVVYATDVRAAGEAVDGIALAEAQNVVAHYPIAAIAGSAQAAAARGFIEFVRSADGAAILGAYGFLPP
jgi:molybdate transport system substrate-binding protein